MLDANVEPHLFRRLRRKGSPHEGLFAGHAVAYNDETHSELLTITSETPGEL